MCLIYSIDVKITIFQFDTHEVIQEGVYESAITIKERITSLVNDNLYY
jgi:hypothetical protein